VTDSGIVPDVVFAEAIATGALLVTLTSLKSTAAEAV